MIAAFPFSGSIATRNRSSKLRVPGWHDVPPVQITPTWLVLLFTRLWAKLTSSVVCTMYVNQVALGSSLLDAVVP